MAGAFRYRAFFQAPGLGGGGGVYHATSSCIAKKSKESQMTTAKPLTEDQEAREALQLLIDKGYSEADILAAMVQVDKDAAFPGRQTRS
jgi:hypothetical protein